MNLRFVLSIIVLMGVLFSDAATVHFFYSPACPYCEQQMPTNEKLMKEYPSVAWVYHDITKQEEAALFTEMLAGLGKEVQGVPTTVIGSTVIVGFSPQSTPDELKNAIEALESNGASSSEATNVEDSASGGGAVSAETEISAPQPAATAVTAAPAVAVQPVKTGSTTTADTTALTCEVPEHLYKELNQLLSKMSTLDPDDPAYASYKQKVENINREMIAAEEKCAGTPAQTPVPVAVVTPTAVPVAAESAPPIKVANATDIYSYYKSKVDAVMESKESSAVKVEQLRVIKSEIDALIEELLKSANEFDAADISPLATEISVKPTEIAVDAVTVAATGKQISAEVSGKRVAVRQAENTVVLEDESGGSAIAEGAKIRSEKLMVGESEVKVLPSEAVASEKGVVKSIEIGEKDGKAVYTATVETSAKILGIFPVKYEKIKEISAESGETLKEKKPWWSFLATEG